MTVDWAGWPLLEIRAGDLSRDDARALVVRALGEALDRGEPFAAMVRMPPAAPEVRDTRGAVDQVRSVRQLRPELAERCRGLVFLLSAEEQSLHAKMLRSGTKVWGCPTAAADGPELARAWLRGRLAPLAPDAD